MIARLDFLIHLDIVLAGKNCRITYRLEAPTSSRQILVGAIALPIDLAATIVGDEADRIACPVEHAILLECAAGRVMVSDALLRRSEALRYLCVPEEGHREAALALLQAARISDSTDPAVLTSLARLELELLDDVAEPASHADRLQQAMRLAKEAARIDPDRPLVTMLLAMAHLRSGCPATARELLARMPAAAVRLPDIAVLAAELVTYLGTADGAAIARAEAALYLHPAPPDWWRQSLVPVLAAVDEQKALAQARMVLWPTLTTLAWHAILAERQGVGSEARETIGQWHARWGSAGISGAARRRAAATAWLHRAMPFIADTRVDEWRASFLHLAGMA